MTQITFSKTLEPTLRDFVALTLHFVASDLLFRSKAEDFYESVKLLNAAINKLGKGNFDIQVDEALKQLRQLLAAPQAFKLGSTTLTLLQKAVDVLQVHNYNVEIEANKSEEHVRSVFGVMLYYLGFVFLFDSI